MTSSGPFQLGFPSDPLGGSAFKCLCGSGGGARKEFAP